MYRSLARLLVVAALACLGLAGLAAAAGAGGLVEGQNTASDGTSESGASSGSNSTTWTAGSTATAADDAQSQQAGSNSASAKQSGSSGTGDSVAGGQIAGGVGNLDVQNQNNASGNSATSGEAAALSSVDVQLGPFAEGFFGGAQASQTGSNALDIGQDLSAESGDAVAGSQITGIAGADEALVQNQNLADDNFAISGDAFADNIVTASVGPFALADLDAQASQIGDNDLVITQSATGASGDGVAGGQITGIVGSGRSFTVQNQNNSSGNGAETGFVEVDNFVAATLGPTAFSAATGAQASQTGDNSATAEQTSDALSGDAVGGSQVTGLVGQEEAHLTVQNQQASEDDFATTGIGFATNDFNVSAGPFAGGVVGVDVATLPSIFPPDEAQASQIGDNDVTFVQESSAASGDAVAAAQITGAVGGDESVVEIQLQNTTGAPFAEALSGGAVAGSQVTGVVVGDDSDVTIAAQNEAAGDGGPVAFADTSLASNLADVQAGPDADAFEDAQASQTGDNAIDGTQVTNDVNTASLAAGPEATSSGDAQAAQTGDDDVALVQEAASASGDAVSGSQVFGVVTGDDSATTIQGQNKSIDAVALSGDIPVVNTATVFAGPTAAGFDDVQASQIGDATVGIDQTIEAATGDALAGSQVVGVVGGPDDTIEIQNLSDGAFAESGIADAVNTATGALGATAESLFDVAQAETTGDTDLGLAQDFTSESGDALAGTEIVGTVL